MIHKITIKNPSKTPIKWLPKVEALKEPRSFEFKPGLNILWGRNGAGKSTLTKLLARLTHCEQGGRPVVTKDSVNNLISGESLWDRLDARESIELIQDGQAVRYFDPGNAVGLAYGGAAFDWDFGAEGVQNVLFKGSSGETTMQRFDRILSEVIVEDVPKVEWKIPRDSVNDDWKKYIEIVDHFLSKNSKEVGSPTIILDEPERSYDLNSQVGTWRFLRAYADKTQFIVASHSLFALNIPEANYIDISPGYLKASVEAMELLKTWDTYKASKFPKSLTKKVKSNLDNYKKRR